MQNFMLYKAVLSQVDKLLGVGSSKLDEIFLFHYQ